MVRISEELKRIGRSEINFSISYFFDDCWQVRLGDDLNGFTHESSYDSIERSVNKLIQEIIKQFPTSNYVNTLRKRSDSVFHGLDLFKEP